MIVRSDNLSDLTPEQRRLALGMAYLRARLAKYERELASQSPAPSQTQSEAVEQ